MPFVISANALRDGRPRYLSPNRTWADLLADARVFDSQEAASVDMGFAREQERDVCDPFLAKVKCDDGVTVAVGQRNQIRAAGISALLNRLGYFEAAKAVR